MTTQLMVRSAYTLLKSTMRVEEIPALAKEYGYTSVALCDVHVLHGAMAFRHACEACGIHPIYGMEVFCTLAQEEESAGFVVLAQNDAGFGELLSLSTWINTQKEPLTIEVLAKHTSNCYVISDAQEDLLYSLLVHEDAAGVRRYLQQMQRSFVHFVCGITKNDSRFLSQRNQLLRRCAAEMDIPCTALGCVYYARESDEEAYRVLCAIDQGLQVDDKTLQSGSGRWFRTPQQMEALYEPQELAMSDVIAENCQVAMALSEGASSGV